MDFTDSVKYYFFRLLILIGSVAVSLVVGKGILWVVASFMPYSLDNVRDFLLDDKVGSIVSAVVILLLIVPVFHDDAKKHAAYEDMDAVPVLIVLLLLLAVYFIPVIFYNPYDITQAGETAYYALYFPCRWLMEAFGADIKTAAALGMAIILGICFVVYQTTYVLYKRKHPFRFKESDDDDMLGDVALNEE